MAAIGRGNMVAVSSLAGPPEFAQKLFRVSRSTAVELADLYAFEEEVNPHPTEIDSNPYGVAVLDGGQFLVADAGGDSLLIVDRRGNAD